MNLIISADDSLVLLINIINLINFHSHLFTNNIIKIIFFKYNFIFLFIPLKMSSNNIFLAAILVMIFCHGTFNQFAVDPATTEMPFVGGQCFAAGGNGSFIFFNVDFRFSKFMELLLANTADEAKNNNCLKFLFCYESSGKYLKPQFKIMNNNNKEIWNRCEENWHGFKINFCLDEHDNLELRISFSSVAEEISRNIAHLPSTISVFRIQFEINNVRIFYRIDDDKKMEELILAKNDNKYSFEFGVDGDKEQQNFWFYNGNKMLQKDLHPWHLLLDLGLIKNVQKGNYHNEENSTIGHIRIHHPEECVSKTISTNQTILIECIGITIESSTVQKDVSCEFDIPNDVQCGKRCKKSMQLKKHHREALISGGQSVIDTTKWPWMIAIEMNSIEINEQGVEIATFSMECSGTIIHPNYLLTAGHCLQYIPKGSNKAKFKLVGIKIYAGHFDSNGATQIIEDKPENVIVHENFIKEYLNETFIYMDIGLIKLSHPLNFSERIRSICLANFQLQNDKIVHLAGWGLTQELDYKGATPIPEENNILQESSAKIIDNGICLSLSIDGIKEKYGDISEEELQEFVNIKKEVNKAYYCLQGLDNSHVQKGDSGSPMMYSVDGTWFTFGIAKGVFLRESLKDKPLPFFYIKIDGQLCEWIKTKTEGKVHCSSGF